MAETEDEAALLAHYADRLGDALANHVPRWARDSVLGRSADTDASASALRIEALAISETVPAIRRLLTTDIDDQWTSPLEIVRSLVPAITAELSALDAPVAARDPGSIEILPNDLFNLTPATFAEIHPDLHEPGLAWGAAKAHVHLRRHAQPHAVPTVVVFAPDLADRTRFDAFTVTHVRSAGKLVELTEAVEPDLVIVDLDRTSAPADFRIDNAHVVGFGSHVDSQRHEDALEAGFDAVMARSVFFRRLPELLHPVAKVRE